MYLVAAFTHSGAPFGSAKVADRREAERTAERYMANPRIGRVAVTELRPVYPAIARGNGRFR